MEKYTVAVLVKNQYGVLNRVTSMFRRRQFNITALTVSETETSKLSRITVQFDGEERNKNQLIDQLYKLPDVHSIKELKSENSYSCELLLVKLKNNPQTRDDLRAAAEAFATKTVDYCKESITMQLVGETGKVNAFLNLMKDFEILEICRTGVASLERGGEALAQITKY